MQNEHSILFCSNFAYPNIFSHYRSCMEMESIKQLLLVPPSHRIKNLNDNHPHKMQNKHPNIFQFHKPQYFYQLKICCEDGTNRPTPWGTSPTNWWQFWISTKFIKFAIIIRYFLNFTHTNISSSTRSGVKRGYIGPNIPVPLPQKGVKILNKFYLSQNEKQGSHSLQHSHIPIFLLILDLL